MFEPGQRVRCMNFAGWRCVEIAATVAGPQGGRVYRIAQVHYEAHPLSGEREAFLALVGQPDCMMFRGACFRPLEDAEMARLAELAEGVKSRDCAEATA